WGAAGSLAHGGFAVLAALETGALRQGPVVGPIVVLAATILATFGSSLAFRVRHRRPAATWVVSGIFGLMVGLAPWALDRFVFTSMPWLGALPVMAATAFLGAFVLGFFLLVLALTGLEHQEGFAALGHPGYRHFVRLRVDPSGKVEGFVVGKDDPLAKGPPRLVDRFAWE